MAGRALRLDLTQPHEAAYARALIDRQPAPQSDLDRMLFGLLTRPGDRVLDAGANIGVTALMALEAGAAQVLGVEPSPALAERLRGLEGPDLKVEEAALSAAPGTAELTLSVTHNQGATLSADLMARFPQVYGDAPPRAQVRVTTIDALVLRTGPFDLWKLDIEGAEIAAAEGAARTLGECPPRAVIVECYDEDLARLSALLTPALPHVRRALCALDDGGLRLAAPERVGEVAAHPTSPVYVFSRDPLPDGIVTPGAAGSAATPPAPSRMASHMLDTERFRAPFAAIELARNIERPDGGATLLDVGGGHGVHTNFFRSMGLEVDLVDILPGHPERHWVGDFTEFEPTKRYDFVWASHVLEHIQNPGQFIDKLRACAKPGGTIAVTVPPLKHDMTFGHVTLWNAGLLLINFIKRGIDCRAARLATYGYNVSILVRNDPATDDEYSRWLPPQVVMNGPYFEGRIDNIALETTAIPQDMRLGGVDFDAPMPELERSLAGREESGFVLARKAAMPGPRFFWWDGALQRLVLVA